MGQEEVLNVLEKEKRKMSCSEIVELVGDRRQEVVRNLKQLTKYKEVKFKEISKDEALKKYKTKRRMKIYFV